MNQAHQPIDSLKNRFTPHELCDEQSERRLEANVQALLENEDTTPSEKIRSCDLQELVKCLWNRRRSE